MITAFRALKLFCFFRTRLEDDRLLVSRAGVNRMKMPQDHKSDVNWKWFQNMRHRATDVKQVEKLVDFVLRKYKEIEINEFLRRSIGVSSAKYT